MTVLIVEDHYDVADTLRMGLEQHGYRVDVVHDGRDAEVEARLNAYDVLIVDWMLPGQDGPALIRRLRQAGVQVPVLMLTARAEKTDQIEALQTGADDYLSKPFSFEVLLARLQALLRRARPGHPAASLHLEVGALRLDLRERAALVGDVALDLREKEYQLLTLLTENPNRVVTRTVLAERIWDSVFVTDDVLNTTIGSLRRKLRRALPGDDTPPVDIETLRGVGYRLRVGAA